jgi:hypothetical protein
MGSIDGTGKHAGETLDEVPAHYIDYLKNDDVSESRPELAVALIKHEREYYMTTTDKHYTLTSG